MSRKIVLDTETTGFKPEEGHRIVEIGCVELVNDIPSGKIFHCYINPERDMPTSAYNVHGLSEEFLRKFKLFKEEALGFLDFVKDDPLIIHNAAFDMKFLNYELRTSGFEILEKNTVIDTLKIAREKFPGSPASLDALCKRFKIDNTARTKHGAIIDCELLADVYLELIGGRQVGMNLETHGSIEENTVTFKEKKLIFREPREFPIPESEKLAHQSFMESYIQKKK